jgi:pimeloyl-ACP methyl ester carboxylesterase
VALGRRTNLAGIAMLTSLALAAGPASAQNSYCDGSGGPAGAATDAEHSVKLGDARLPAGVRSGRVTVDGVSTRVLEAGPANAKEAVLFLHGSPTNARDWDDLLAATGRFTRAIAIDMPGYGKSQKNVGARQNSDGAVRFIQRTIEELGLRRVVLVGHDYGGIWGVRWASRNPKALIAAVLIDGGLLIDYVPHPYAVTWATPGAGEAQMASTTRESFTSNFQALSPKPFPAGYLDRLYDDYDRATRCAILRYYRSTSEDYQTAPREQAARLRPHNRPALVLWGQKDPYVPPEQAEKQRQAFPSARIVLFEESGHFPHVDDPPRTRNVVLPFLRPGLKVSRTRSRQRRRRVVVPVRASGLLPVHGVRARIRGGRGASRPASFRGSRSLVIRRRRALRRGRYRIDVTASGLPRQTVVLRVRR